MTKEQTLIRALLNKRNKNLSLIKRADNLLALDEALAQVSAICPSSVKHHHFWRGGYSSHVFQVMAYGAMLLPTVSIPSVSVYDYLEAAYFHDLDKLDNRYALAGPDKFTYSKEFVPKAPECYIVKLSMQFGLVLSDAQMHAITYHHGGWCSELQLGMLDVPLSPMAVLLHTCDLMSARVWGKSRELSDEVNMQLAKNCGLLEG